MIRLSLSLVSIVVFNSYLCAQQLILQPNATDGIDASLGYHDYYGTEDNNYGTDIYIKAFCIPGFSGGQNTNRALIEFDLSQIPPGMEIVSASLELSATGYLNTELPGHFGNNQAYIKAVESQWFENTVTWNTAPSLSTTDLILLPQSTSSTQDYTIDVTSLVTIMYDDPSSFFGFHLGLVNEDPNDPAALAFYSSDAANAADRPKLTINYVSKNGATLCFQDGATEGTDASLGYHDNYGTSANNYGSDQYLKAYCIEGASGGQNTNRALFKFDLSSIPVGATIISANLELFGAGYVNTILTGHSGNNEAFIYRVTDPWTENTVTWDSQPAYSLTDMATLPQSTSSAQNYTINVTGMTNYMIQNPLSNYGFFMKLQIEDPNDESALVFYSSDAADASVHPKLCVEYIIDGLSVKTDITQSKEKMLLYPNPANSELFISVPDENISGAFELNVINSAGQRLNVNFTQMDQRILLNVSDLPNGMYQVILIHQNAVYQEKLIIQN